MKYLSNKKGFLGTDNKFNFKAKAVIVPFGLEKTVSYGTGTKNISIARKYLQTDFRMCLDYHFKK